MGRAGVATMAVLAMLAAACGGPDALARPTPAGESALGPTVLLDTNANSRGVTPSAPSTDTLPSTPPLPPVPAPPPPPDPVRVLAAGNLGRCQSHGTQLGDAVVTDIGLILAVGDIFADPASATDACLFDRLSTNVDRLYAVPGDQDLVNDDGAAFYDLIEQTATGSNRGEGWFVTSIGGWQLIGLNSQCEEVGGCGVDSAQYQWLDDVLSSEPAECRAAIWHDARFTSASGEAPANSMGAILGRLDGAGVDVLITGSPGNYERLGPLRPSGQPALAGEAGAMHFNIGGGSAVGFDEELEPGSAARSDSTNGYVRFVFSPGSYAWEFVATSEGTAEPDIGSANC